MVNENVQSIYALMSANEEVAAKLASITSPEDAVAILGENGIHVTVDDLKVMVDILYGDEIPVEMLDLVAGGGKIRDFFWGFCDGLRGAFNEARDVIKSLFGK